jgi:spore coat protein U-like protein
MTIVNLVAEHRLIRAIGRFAVLIACASALVLSSVSPAFAVLTCSAANVLLNYGAYDVLAGTVLDAAGTITVSCTRDNVGAQNQSVTYAVALTPLTPRQLAPPSGTDRLSHQLYLDAARTAQPWGDGATGGTFIITGTFTVPKSSTAFDVPRNFYARITPGGQDVSAASPGPPPTTYTQTFTVTVTCTSPAVAC